MKNKIYVPAVKVCYPCCKPRIVHWHCEISTEDFSKSKLAALCCFFESNGYEILAKKIYEFEIDL